MDKNINQIPDTAIDKALDMPMGLGQTLRQLIRGDTVAVGYSKIAVVRKLLDALNVYAFQPSSRLRSTPLQAFKDWESAAATPGATVIHDEVMLPDSIHKIADEMRARCDDSDGAQYGTIATGTVRAWANRIEALAVVSDEMVAEFCDKMLTAAAGPNWRVRMSEATTAFWMDEVRAALEAALRSGAQS